MLGLKLLMFINRSIGGLCAFPSKALFFIAFMCARASPLGPVACPNNPT